MRYQIAFVAGLAVGYVLGSRAGRERYEQIAKAARGIVENPTVQETAGLVRAQVTSAGKTAYTKISEKLPVSSLRDFLSRPTPEEEAELDRVEAAAPRD
ncbi:hypothetical protein [Thermobifida cellulosilytica]|uniref:Protoporphyrinogen oxidase n=1 Tax=Thermobifida cellulosilytica TB100 TaxID=665004 RepID=A0A147KD81_THECS|nr:hypothetical protein [Thermobifida cellulosilytica]KUP95253.1 hypothetical protein AC529_18840 [Thermobifida cellulosilytica TB100]